LCQKDGSAGLKGWRDDVIKEYTNMHKHPLIMYTLTENPKSKCRIFFYCNLHDFTSRWRVWTALLLILTASYGQLQSEVEFTLD